jgi:hypothetical protein
MEGGELVRRTLAGIIVWLCILLAIGLATTEASASLVADFQGGSWTLSEEEVIKEAVAEWTSLLSITQNLTVTFFLANLSGTTLAQTAIYSASAGLPTSATITVDTDSWISWSLASAASGFYDALSIVEHELGHALGIAYQSNLLYYYAVTRDASGYAWIDGYALYGSTNAGSLSHLADSADLMYPYISAGVRSSISDADIDILYAVYGYAETVPVPASLLLLGCGLAGLCLIRRRHGK